MVAYRRYYIKGGTWFFTVNLKDRRSMHLTENIELLRYSVAVVKQHRPFIIDAWVVLPEHLHCIWTLPHNDDDFSSRWRDIKGCFTRTLKRQPLWQPRFWEHAIRDEDDYRRHVDDCPRSYHFLSYPFCSRPAFIISAVIPLLAVLV